METVYPQCCQDEKVQTLQLQPLQTWTQAPTKSSRVIILKVHLPAIFYDIETEGLSTVTHGYTSYWHNWDCVPLTYDPCSGRYLCSFSNDIRRKLVEKIRICKKGWCALVCLSVAQFNPFGPLENLIWYRCCSTSCIYFPSWKSLPVAAQTLVLLELSLKGINIMHNNRKLVVYESFKRDYILEVTHF